MTEQDPAIEVVAEYALIDKHRQAIRELLSKSFPSYPAEELFYPQPPHFRILHWTGERLTGHVSGVIRAIKAAGRPMTILGLADLCIDKEWVGRRIASQLIEHMAYIARAQQLPFLMVMAATPELYGKNGFQQLDVRCTWLAYLDGRSLGLFQRTPPSGLMVKSLGDQAWPEGPVDLLGPLF